MASGIALGLLAMVGAGIIAAAIAWTIYSDRDPYDYYEDDHKW